MRYDDLDTGKSFFDITVKVALFSKEGRVLMVHEKKSDVTGLDGKSKPKYPGWGLPGGRALPQEKRAEEVGRRELWEELGLSPDMYTLDPEWCYRRKDPHHIFLLMQGTCPEEYVLAPNEDEKIDEIRWMSRNDIESGLFRIYGTQPDSFKSRPYDGLPHYGIRKLLLEGAPFGARVPSPFPKLSA